MDMLVRGKYIIENAEAKEAGILTNGAVYVAEGIITEVNDYQLLKEKYPEAPVKGDGGQLLMPGLIDGHSHGSGLSPFQKGIPYDFLENNFFDWAFSINLDPELQAMVSAVRHLRNGCTTMNCNTGGTLERIEKLISGFQETGIRLAFSLSGADTNWLALDDSEFIKTLPPDLREFAEPEVYFDRKAYRDEFFDTFEHLYDEYHTESTRVIFGPALATMCTDGFLQQIKSRADELGKLQIHIHTLQTPIQKAYALRKHGKSQIAHFEDIEVLDENLTIGHAVFLTEPDIEFLASNQVSTTHHPNCNFVIRNGISPVYHLLKAGVNVALGIDDKGFNDDEDAITELRLIHRLHRVTGFDLANTPALDAFDVLEMGTTNAARVCGYEGEVGAIRPGMKADLILVDLQEMMNDPWMSPEMNIAEVFIHRAKGIHVNTVIVDGKVIVEDHKFLSVDVEQLYDEVRNQTARGLSAEQRAYAETLERIKPYCQEWYRDWVEMAFDPFYIMNSRK
jgi:5-methylthioadenosine/S-adenosylhomocysteine deaminase